MPSFWKSTVNGLSSFADSLSDTFNLTGPISESANANPDDVLKTKKALSAVGAYPEPKNGAYSDIPDRQTIDGLKQVQKQNGLKVDGIMKPNGPTAQVIGQELSAQQGITAANTSQNAPTPTPSTPPSRNASASASFAPPKPTIPQGPPMQRPQAAQDNMPSRDDIIQNIRSKDAETGFEMITKVRSNEEFFNALPEDIKDAYQGYIMRERSSEIHHRHDPNNTQKAVSRGVSSGAVHYAGQDMSNKTGKILDNAKDGLSQVYGVSKNTRDEYEKKSNKELEKNAIPSNYQGRTIADAYGQLLEQFPGISHLITAKEYGDLARNAGAGDVGSQAASIVGLFSGKIGKNIAEYGTKGADKLVESITGKKLSEVTPQLAQKIKDQLIEKGVDAGLRQTIEDVLP